MEPNAHIAYPFDRRSLSQQSIFLEDIDVMLKRDKLRASAPEYHRMLLISKVNFINLRCLDIAWVASSILPTIETPDIFSLPGFLCSMASDDVQNA